MSGQNNSQRVSGMFSWVLFSHVEHLLLTATKKTIKHSVNEIKQLGTFHGSDVFVYVLYVVLRENEKSQQNSGVKLQILHLVFNNVVQKMKLPLIVLKALKQFAPQDHFVFMKTLFKHLKLPLQAELQLLVGGLANCEDEGIQGGSLRVLKQKIASLPNSKDSYHMPVDTFHSLLYFVQNNPASFSEAEVGVVAEALKKNHHSQDAGPVMYPLLRRDGRQPESLIIPRKSTAHQLLTKINSQSRVADVMEDLGYACAATSRNLKIILNHFPLFKSQDIEVEIARIIGMMSRTHTGLEENGEMYSFNNNSNWSSRIGMKTWNINVFVDTIKEVYSKVNWTTIIANLDHPEFQLYDSRGFGLIVSMYKRATKNAFPVEALFGLWTNTCAQLSVLKLAVSSSPEVFTFFAQPPFFHKMEGAAQVVQAAIETSDQFWFSVPLIQTLLDLSEAENYSLVRLIFDHPIKTCPEILLLGLAQVKNRNSLHNELADLLVSIFLGNHPSSIWVLSTIWFSFPSFHMANRLMIVRGMERGYQHDISNLGRLLDVTQLVLKTAPFVLNARNYVEGSGDELVRICLKLIAQQVQANEFDPNFNIGVFGGFFRGLEENLNTLSPPVQEQLKAMQSTQQQPQQREVFPPQIEARANSLFQQIYTGQLAIDQAMKLLEKFKDSTKENQDVFACMLHSLFDEFRFFASYPEKELQITGILFGQLIQNGLISYIPLGIAFRYVLEALREAPTSKMFTFGVLALDQFKGKLNQWPQVCNFLVQIPHLQKFHPGLMKWIDMTVVEQARKQGTGPLQGPPPAEKADEIPTQPPVEKAKKSTKKKAAKSSPFSHLPIEILLESAVDVDEPSEKVVDKLFFIFNTVAPINLDKKAVDMRDLIEDEFLPFFARYFIVKRIAIEPNFHDLYDKFQAYICRLIKGFNRMMLDETLRCILVLLNSPDIGTSSSQRAILKNLGSWIGRMTLAKNKPLLHNDLCPKQLIVDAYSSGQLIVVVPFVAKILACAKNSLVFSPPNVWTMAQLSVLTELYHLTDLKLTLKFETEVLCNHLEVDLSTIKPTTLFVNIVDTPGTENKVVTNLEKFINVPPNLPLMIPIRQLVPIAIESAMREIIQAVVERSVAIASCTSSELISLDFATEGDEAKMRQSAIMMARSLAGSLASVTCAEPMRANMSTHLRQLIESQLGSRKEGLQAAINQTVLMTVKENLELACSLIEKAATERAVRETDEILEKSFEGRRMHRKLHPGVPFFDHTYAGQFPPSLPERLRPHRTGLTTEQLRGYDGFSALCVGLERFHNLPSINMDVGSKSGKSKISNIGSGIETSPNPSNSKNETVSNDNNNIVEKMEKDDKISETNNVNVGKNIQSPSPGGSRGNSKK